MKPLDTTIRRHLFLERTRRRAHAATFLVWLIFSIALTSAIFLALTNTTH
jgi:hypothetical protein